MVKRFHIIGSVPSMEVCKQRYPHYFHKEEDDADYSESGGYDSNSDCDSDMDPSYCIVEDTQGKLSDLSIKKKPKSRIGKKLDEGFDRDPKWVELNVEEVDEKGFEEVQKIIKAGEIEKLKVEQCKVYLRKNGLRLTGKKGTLLLRIKEHQEILHGRGEQKYPVSSFVLNCKGDACTGDVVMFEQNVYETYSIVSRSASGPPCGTRIVVGRIVKESYGAAKQQHTFTIEVLWSKGEKPLQPLHPLLIKGRNLYRLKTLRQKWEDEGERQKVLMDKHSRGSLARCARESRIQDKQMRKTLRENKGLKKERNRYQSQSKSNQGIRTQHLCSSINLGKTAPESQVSGLLIDSGIMTSQTQNYGSYMNAAKHNEATKSAEHPPVNKNPSTTWENGFTERYHHRQPLTNMNECHPIIPLNENQGTTWDNGFAERFHHRRPLTSMNYCHPIIPLNKNQGTTWENGFVERYHHRQPLTSMNNGHPVIPLNRQGCKQQQGCKFYAQGRCFYGDNCKFLHD